MFFEIGKWEWWWEGLVACLPTFLGKEQKHSGRNWILLEFCHLNSCLLLHTHTHNKQTNKHQKEISSWSSRTLLFHIQIQCIASTSTKFSGYLTFGFYLTINFFFFFYLTSYREIILFIIIISFFIYRSCYYQDCC